MRAATRAGTFALHFQPQLTGDGRVLEFIIDFRGGVNGDRTSSQLGDIRDSINGLVAFTAQTPGIGGSTRSLRHVLVDGSGLDLSGPTQGGTSARSIDQQFLISVPISNAARNVFSGFSLTATALGAGFAGFGNTAGLALVLLAGLGFTSDSGVLPGTPVPLPEVLPMQGLAVLLLGRRCRRSPTRRA